MKRIPDAQAREPAPSTLKPLRPAFEPILSTEILFPKQVKQMPTRSDCLITCGVGSQESTFGEIPIDENSV